MRESLKWVLLVWKLSCYCIQTVVGAVTGGQEQLSSGWAISLHDAAPVLLHAVFPHGPVWASSPHSSFKAVGQLTWRLRLLPELRRARCINVYDIVSDIIQCHFYCVLLATSKSRTCPDSRGEEGKSTSWWGSVTFLEKLRNRRCSSKENSGVPSACHTLSTQLGTPSMLHLLCPYPFNPNLL